MKNFRSMTNAQSRILLMILAAIIVAVFAMIGSGTNSLFSIGLFHAHAQTAITGEWTAHVSTGTPAGRINLNFSRQSEKGGFNMSGDTYALTELQGPTLDTKSAAKTDVKFSVVREAGTITCEGVFTGGRGTGFWTFTPNASYGSAMRQRGFGNLSDEDLLRATLHNLTTRYADDLKAAGYDKLTLDDLNRASNHDITVAYINELSSAGLSQLPMSDLIRASNHDINAAYVKSVADMGFTKLSLDKLIQLSNHDIDAAFVGEMKSGFGDLSPELLISLKNHDVTGDFINEIKAEGYSNISPQLAISLKNHDVDREFIRKAKAQYPNATLEELIRLSSRGVIK